MQNRKRFLLVHPEISRTKYNFAGVIDNEPLELEYIWTMLLAHGYEPDIWDGQVEKEPLTEKLKAFRPAYVYICGRTRQENFMKEYCTAAKKLCGSTVFFGGLHAQHNYARFYDSDADYILKTFDIFCIPALLDGSAPASLDGICYREGGVWHDTPSVAFDIKRLPRANRSYFLAHTDRYRYLELLPCAHVRTAYCCPFRCRFCYRNRLNCGVYSARPIEDVVDEIASLECENIYFIDDDFLIDTGRVEQFIQLVKERGIRKKYVCYGRADFIAAHPDLMTALKEIGFYYILVGLEAINDGFLKDYNKCCDLDSNIRAVEILNAAGIHIMGMFIVGLDFTAKDFRNLYRWIVRHELKHTAISIFTPEMASELMETYKDRLITENPEAWDYLHVVAKPEKLSVRRYYFHYHILLIRLFLKGKRDGIYDFIDYGYYVKSFLRNLFRFGG